MKKIEFSKIIVALVMATYFIGVILGGYVVLIKVPEQLGEYLLFIGTATTATISFYCWKAKGENVVKIEKQVDGYGMPTLETEDENEVF